MFLIFGVLNITTASRIRRTKQVTHATRRKAWVKKLTDKEVEKHAKGRLRLAIASLLLGLFLLAGFFVLILE